LLVAVAVARFVVGRDTLARYGDRLAETIPAALGAGGWVQALFDAGLSLSPVAVVFAVFMGSAYGRGLSRALSRFAPEDQRELPPSWWSRAMTLPLLGLAPLLLLGLLLVTPSVSDLMQGNDVFGVLGASYLGLNAIWAGAAGLAGGDHRRGGDRRVHLRLPAGLHPVPGVAGRPGPAVRRPGRGRCDVRPPALALGPARSGLHRLHPHLGRGP
jgi:hypothetical protein